MSNAARLDLAVDAFCRANLDVARISAEIRANHCEEAAPGDDITPGVIACWLDARRGEPGNPVCPTCAENARRVSERTDAKVRRAAAKRRLVTAWKKVVSA